MKKSNSIIICALIEEKNIEKLLQDRIGQKFDVDLENI